MTVKAAFLQGPEDILYLDMTVGLQAGKNIVLNLFFPSFGALVRSFQVDCDAPRVPGTHVAPSLKPTILARIISPPMGFLSCSGTYGHAVCHRRRSQLRARAKLNGARDWPRRLSFFV